MAGSRAYLHKALAPDPQVGFVDFDGKVYETRLGPDKYVGWVELGTGKVFETRLGPDHYIGRIDLSNGNIFRQKVGAPDEYIADVDRDGNIFLHKALAPDPYVGNITPMPGYAQAGAAFLLLLESELHRSETN